MSRSVSHSLAAAAAVFLALTSIGAVVSVPAAQALPLAPAIA